MENSALKLEEQLNGGGLAEMSEFGRLFGFRRPEAAMRDIVARPSYFVPLALTCLAAAAYLTVARPQLTWTRDEAVLATAGTAAAVIVRLLLIAGFLTAFAAIVSRTPVSFSQVFAVVCYSRMPGVAFIVLAIILILMRRASGLPDSHPLNPLLTSLAVFLDPRTTSRFTYSVASSVDCVVFWQLSLIAIGLRAATRLSSTATRVGIVAVWLLNTFAQAAWIQWMGR